MNDNTSPINSCFQDLTKWQHPLTTVMAPSASLSLSRNLESSVIARHRGQRVGRFQDPLEAFPKAQSQSGHGHLPGFFSVLVKALTVDEVRDRVCLLIEESCTWYPDFAPPASLYASFSLALGAHHQSSQPVKLWGQREVRALSSLLAKWSADELSLERGHSCSKATQPTGHLFTEQGSSAAVTIKVTLSSSTWVPNQAYLSSPLIECAGT